MTNHTRGVLSFLGGFLLGCVGGFIAAVFGPLVFPATPSGSSLGENIVVFSLPAFFLAFGILGFLICWRFAKRFAEKTRGSNRTFTDRARALYPSDAGSRPTAALAVPVAARFGGVLRCWVP